MLTLAATLTFEPLIAPSLWLVLALGVAVGFGIYAWRRPAGMPRGFWALIVSLQGLAAFAVLLILLNPLWLESVPPPAGKPLLTFLVDASGSMQVKDTQGETRFAAARHAIEQMSSGLQEKFDIQVRAFSDHAVTESIADLEKQNPGGRVTDLAIALRESVALDRPQGQAMVLVSDGIHNASGGMDSVLEASRMANSMSSPVSVYPVGGNTQLADVSVSVPRPQELAYVGQKVPIEVHVEERGGLGKRFDVILKDDTTELARKTAEVDAAGRATLDFDLVARKPGVFRYELNVIGPAGETVTGNNVATVVMRVSNLPIRVLVLEGKPYWDTKFLLRTLSADAMLEVDSLTKLTNVRMLRREMRVRSLEDSAATSASETLAKDNGPDDAALLAGRVRTDTSKTIQSSVEAQLTTQILSEYQVVVLGRDAEAFLTPKVVEQLRQWMARDGGSLVCFRGAPVSNLTQQLAAMMPVRWSPGSEARFHPHLTVRGQAADWLAGTNPADTSEMDTLPSLTMQSQPGRPSPLAVVLASGSDASGPPVVSYQPYGAGRTVTVEGAGMWRWAFLPPSQDGREDVYSRLWRSLIRWLVSSVGLAPGQDLLLRTDRVTYHEGDAVSMQVLAREDVWQTLPPLQLYRNGELLAQKFLAAPVGDEAGVYQVNLGQLPEGRYEARIAGTGGGTRTEGTAFDVQPFLKEQLDTVARPDVLARIARETGGNVLTSLSSSEFTKGYDQHVLKTRPEQTRRYSAWDRWWVLIGIVALWGTAWTLRRRGGAL